MIRTAAMTGKGEPSVPLVPSQDDASAGAEEADEEATAPLTRELSELEAKSIFPGVPLS
jgi:hypothetical protein